MLFGSLASFPGLAVVAAGAAQFSGELAQLGGRVVLVRIPEEPCGDACGKSGAVLFKEGEAAAGVIRQGFDPEE